MAWAQGETLGEFLEDNRGKKGALASLLPSLVSMSAFLEKEKVAHGDMSPGNIMVSKGGAIQLIDYDGMFVEDIRDIGSSELGNINFQHPARSQSNPFGPTMDRFSLISLSLALTALNDDPSLWDKTNSDIDGIVFRANDYIDPASSPVFSALMGKTALAPLAQRFAAVCKAPLDKTPSLEDFLAGRNIPAGTVQITAVPQRDRPKPGYMGVYDVLDAMSYDLCLRRVGDKVEVIGRIIEVKQDKARNGKPYIFINFGPWQGKIFKISIWSEGLAVLSKKPDASWVGKWISVVGLMEPAYTNTRLKYSHLSINVTANNQMSVISETEAKWRLTPFSSRIDQTGTSNKEMLERIKGTTSPTTQTRTPSSSLNQNILNNIRAVQGGAQSRPSQSNATTTQSQQPSINRQPKPPEKGLLDTLFGWIFK
jgi:serine/threonine protein kinase